MNKQLQKWIIFTLASLILVPALVYLGGSLVVGPYEGEFGLLGMMGNIYGDAAKFRPGALLVLLGPVILVGIWVACARVQRAITAHYAAV